MAQCVTSCHDTQALELDPGEVVGCLPNSGKSTLPTGNAPAQLLSVHAALCPWTFCKTSRVGMKLSLGLGSLEPCQILGAARHWILEQMGTAVVKAALRLY